jgi:outer membrane protein assembly factor BamC
VAAAEAVLGRFGLHLAQELPAAGIMETEWNENRAKIPQDFIRNTIGKVFDSVYSSGERDKFRTRIERRADGSSEIYISHRGVQEVTVGAEETTSGRRVLTIRAWKPNSWRAC